MINFESDFVKFLAQRRFILVLAHPFVIALLPARRRRDGRCARLCLDSRQVPDTDSQFGRTILRRAQVARCRLAVRTGIDRSNSLVLAG